MQATKHTKKLILAAALTSSVLLTQACTPLIVAGSVAGAGTAIGYDRRNVENIIEDNAIELRATDAIYSDGIIGKSVHIDVHSYNGIVLLTGEAPTKEMREHAGHVAYAMRNIREVYNEINIAKPSSIEDRTQDSWISRKVQLNILADKGLFSHSKVITSHGVVYLMGLVTPEESRQLQNIVAQVKGVRGVVPLFEPIDTSPDDILKTSTAQVRKNVITTEKKEKPEDDGLTILPYTLQPPVEQSRE